MGTASDGHDPSGARPSTTAGPVAIEGEPAPTPLHVTIISGLSGAGKSQAVATFEDVGYFCIDNLPPQMLVRVAELFTLEGSKVDRVALVFDARGGAYFTYLDRELAELERRGIRYRVVFLEATDEALVARFQSTRRRHPLAAGEDVLDGIREERRVLAQLRERADVVIDTTGLNVHELRHRLRETLLAGELTDQLLITFLSFGYKFGVPAEADIMFDARFLPNPHWVEELRPLTGLDEAVREYVVGRSETYGFVQRATDLIQYLVPLYLAEQKANLVVAVGCTGGRHRSVALAETFAQHFAKDPTVVTSVRHRDVGRAG